jgi:hypothetical protein
MEDCFVCNHLTYKRDFCTLYGIWDSNIIEKCNKCENKKCELCCNENSNILKDGEWLPCCDDCTLKSEVINSAKNIDY